jgi:Holliday junction resolvase
VRQAARVDSNHAEIVEALRKAGCSVRSLAAVGKGIPDLLVGVCGINLILEVKVPGGKLTEDQIDFASAWSGQWAVVHSPEEAVNYVQASKYFVEKIK